MLLITKDILCYCDSKNAFFESNSSKKNIYFLMTGCVYFLGFAPFLFYSRYGNVIRSIKIGKGLTTTFLLCAHRSILCKNLGNVKFYNQSVC